jgi:hypothetical protein
MIKMTKQKIEIGCYYCKFRTDLYCNKRKYGVAGTGIIGKVYNVNDLLAIKEYDVNLNIRNIGKPYGYLCEFFQSNTTFVFR